MRHVADFWTLRMRSEPIVAAKLFSIIFEYQSGTSNWEYKNDGEYDNFFWLYRLKMSETLILRNVVKMHGLNVLMDRVQI